jgi:hypothetical protein
LNNPEIDRGNAALSHAISPEAIKPAEETAARPRFCWVELDRKGLLPNQQSVINN